MQEMSSQRYSSLILLILVIVIVTACEKRAEEVSDMGVSFKWNPPKTQYQNPEIHLTGIPEATHRFLVKLVDLDLKTYNHGGGYYLHNGFSVIPPGELDGDYQGPSPPPGIVHQYQITVKALNADDVVIGEGRYTRQYPEND